MLINLLRHSAQNAGLDQGPLVDVNAVSELGFSDLDVAFAQFIASQEAEYATTMGLLAGLLSQHLGKQNTCLQLDLLGVATLKKLNVKDRSQLHTVLRNAQTVTWVEPESSANLKSPTPIVYCDGLLYLQRYWHYEEQLVAQIKQRVGQLETFDTAKAKAVIESLFEANVEGQTDWQKVAVCMAASQRFSMITGGPGTGKTTTVAKLLALLHAINPNRDRHLKVELVAPTGKAAARLTESIANARAGLPDRYQSALEVKCSTIHRLLGSIPKRIDFRHNQQALLHLDVLIVDEASMVDLPLMCKLFQAVPCLAKIILLGDQNQLSSVEAGSVLSDICKAALQQQDVPDYSDALRQRVEQMSGQYLPGSTHSLTISDCLTTLQKSHRFSADSGIGQVAQATIDMQSHQVISVLDSNHHDDVSWLKLAGNTELVSHYVGQLHGYFDALNRADLLDAFAQFDQLQILCASRKGEWGVETLNQLIETELARQGYIQSHRQDYPGRPIMLGQNDHALQVYNGDIGIVLPDPKQPDVSKAWFRQVDGSLRGILISRLPEHDTVYAMTIHKSQGSEFDSIYLCLPHQPMTNEQHLSRELFYTGLTRARKKFVLYATEVELNNCLKHGCIRTSGLANRLV